MKTHTNAFKNQIKEFGRQLDTYITYTINNEEIELDAEQLNSVSPHYEGAILKSVMKQLDIDSNVNIPVDTVINVRFGVKVRNDEVEDYKDNYDYIDFGNYVVFSSEKQEDTRSYKIICYDKMLYAMKDYKALNITYPITIRNYISAICDELDLTFKNASETFANYNREIPVERYLDADGNSLGYTFRDVLDELAQVTASIICINEEDDELEIRYIDKGSTQYLLKNMEENTDVSNMIFKVDTTSYTSEELTANISGLNTIVGINTANNSGILVWLAEGNGITGLESEYGLNTYYPNGEVFTVDNSYIYAFYIEVVNDEPTKIVVLNDLTNNEIYGNYNIPNGSILQGIDKDHYSESVIWNCFKIESASEKDTIDEEYLKDINVNFGEKYGPINSIVLSRAEESDNVYLRDETSIQQNGLCELKIKDNQIMNFNDRSDYLSDILNSLDGLEYYINDFGSTGICYYNIGDGYNISIDENEYNCIMLNDEINITQGLEEHIHTDKLEESVTDYTKADKTDRRLNQTYILADKANQQITSVVANVEELNDTVTELGTRYTQTVDEFSYQITQLNDTVTQSNEDFEERINTLETTDPERLQNTLVTINVNGIQVSTNLSKISTMMTNDTFLIQDSSGTKLAYFGYDETLGRSVSQMDNLTVTNYFTAGYHRQQKFDIDGEYRTGWFYTGGV